MGKFKPADKAQKDVDAKTLRVLAGVEPGDHWYVWRLGQPNPMNGGLRPKYFLGRVEGPRQQAVWAAQKRWPNFQGEMLLEKVPTPAR